MKCWRGEWRVSLPRGSRETRPDGRILLRQIRRIRHDTPATGEHGSTTAASSCRAGGIPLCEVGVSLDVPAKRTIRHYRSCWMNSVAIDQLEIIMERRLAALPGILRPYTALPRDLPRGTRVDRAAGRRQDHISAPSSAQEELPLPLRSRSAARHLPAPRYRPRHLHARVRRRGD